MGKTTDIATSTIDTASPASLEGKLHIWISGDGRDVWHYCSVCRTVRNPNGKLDKNICPGPRKPSYIPPSKRKSAPVSLTPLSAPEQNRVDPSPG